MKLSLIISSFNQRKRLRLCLQSALKQQLGPNATGYEIIVADDNSTDGTKEMLETQFKNSVKVSYNTKSQKNVYTLADNWNDAAKLATGERLIFSNGDLIYIVKFIEAHADPLMKDHIILGPAMRTSFHVYPMIDENTDYIQLLREVNKNNWLAPDMRMGLIAHTYNKEEPPWHVYGYNFSLPRKYFEGVGGFPPFKKYGGEDLKISEAVVDKYKCKCLTNQNAMAIHLYHPQYNCHGKIYKNNYNL